LEAVDAEKLGRRASLAGMIISGGLAVAKILIGWHAGSQAVIADGAESAMDVLTSLAVLISLTVAIRPPDEDHPYGHGRFEILTGLMVGHVLTLTGVLIVWRSVVVMIGAHRTPAAYALWPLAVSIVLKSFLSAYKMHTGRKIGSSALVADAWNDAVDILSGSVALIAVGMSVLSPVLFRQADPIGGILVGSIIVVLGFKVVRETTLHLMDTMPESGSMQEIRSSALTIAGALGVEKCFARKTGLRYHVDLHLEVDPDLTVRDSHSIAEQVRNRVKADLPWVADVLVHVEPHPPGLRQNCAE
jgi:cation diffusion facilitator family transporter